MFLLYYLCLQNFKKIKDQLLCHQTNVKISRFYNLKLCIKNKFINWIVNNIRFEWNLICMLRTQGTWNLMVIFLNFTPKNELHEKFENSLQTSLERNFVHLIYIYIYISGHVARWKKKIWTCSLVYITAQRPFCKYGHTLQ